MKNQIKSIKNYNFSNSDRLCLDTNVWIYVFCPQKPNAPLVEVYSQAFRSILEKKGHIYINSLITSEFINRSAKFQFDLQKTNGIKSFKAFRESPVFKPIALNIAADLKRILGLSSRLECNFKELDINTLINEYGKGSYDFNDQMITELCKHNGLTLITHDIDFYNHDIPIITANPRLINA
ncbi:MAG: PIN domain-containing protein [Proteobacteria bacterium]|nr:PIN domain-containing protein [Pseudomonadota bacterium]